MWRRYLKIQLDRISGDANTHLNEADQARVADALDYIRQLPFPDADANLRKYGRTLLTHLPGPTTELLKQLCTGRFGNDVRISKD